MVITSLFVIPGKNVNFNAGGIFKFTEIGLFKHAVSVLHSYLTLFTVILVLSYQFCKFST